MYGKLAGMTGTADTEAYEFQEIYGLETVVIPTHRPMVRDDRQLDQVYQDGRARSTSAIVIKDIKRLLTSAANRCWSALRRSRSSELLSQAN